MQARPRVGGGGGGAPLTGRGGKHRRIVYASARARLVILLTHAINIYLQMCLFSFIFYKCVLARGVLSFSNEKPIEPTRLCVFADRRPEKIVI